MEAPLNPNRPRRVLRRATLLSLGLFAAVSLLPNGAPAADQEPEKMEKARVAIQDWVKTRQLISEERAEWTLRKRLLEDEIGLLGGEITDLRGRIAEIETSIREARGTEGELTAQNDTLKASSVTLRERVEGLEVRVKALLARMPERVQQQVAPLSQSMPEDPTDTKLSLSVRYRNIVNILNLINKFNRELHLESELRTLANGTEADVPVLYFGIGQAFYATADGTSAGIGTAGPDGWTWIPANEHAEAIAQLIAIYQNEQPAAFVQVPVQIQ